MEQGAEFEEEVDTILGLDRMKTRHELRREKTLHRLGERRRSSKALLSFKNAADKITGARKHDTAKTPLDAILQGDLSAECPSTTKIVRIFTSSTFTDTQHERNTLMRFGYPVLKAWCQQLGYDFQVVDMRWGIRDQATDDHMGTEICLKELRMCQKLSTGPNFVSLMSHKYGYTDFPRCIDAREFETIMDEIKSTETTALFNKWYRKDLNAEPPVYVAFPISTHLPDFISNDKEKKDAAKKAWWGEMETLQRTLEEVAQRVFDAETAHKFIRSITETEVHAGLLTAADPPAQCLWLRRTLNGIETQDNSYLLSRFQECGDNSSEEKVQKVRKMHADLTRSMQAKLNDSVLSYTVDWDPEKGINPELESHRNYLKQMTEDFVSRMRDVISLAITRHRQIDDPLVEEVVEHAQFCQKKCDSFHGREDLRKYIGDYVAGMSNEPLVLHGDSGSGKTSVLAMAARSSAAWARKNAVVVVRFIGTTPSSSNLMGLLASITQQIRRAYHVDQNVSMDLRQLVDEFALSLFLPTVERPLVLILDSLDMLDPSHNARQLQWLPIRLRPNVKVILSTLTDAQFESFPILSSIIRTKENIIKVPTLTQADFEEIVDGWLKKRRRNLTADQKKMLMHMCLKCPSPLFLKLTFDKACTWTSFAAQSATVLEASIRTCIDGLFQRLEDMHGQIFVSRALGYLTISRSGLTETELEDVLSCDDDVLNDVYMYWTPPIRRLPPMLLLRLRDDLKHYLVDRCADHVKVVSWYHRQFIEAAENRYLSNVATNKKLHAALAEFFAGTWAGREKEYVTPKNEKGSADRHVTSQPNKFGTTYNMRKLANLPYHRSMAGQLQLLKEETLCNFEFLVDKLKATNLWQIMDDFALARRLFTDDEALANIDDVLRLSQVALFDDANQLIPQILGRLKPNKSNEAFLAKCRGCPVPFLLPDKLILTQPGGQLIHSMAGHKGDISSLDLSVDSKTALTCSDDGSVRLWSTESGQQLRVYDGLGKVSRARFCCRDQYFLIDQANKLTLRNAITGEKVFDLNSVTDDYPSCLCGENQSVLVVFRVGGVMALDLTDQSTLFTFECFDAPAEDGMRFEHPSIAAGSRNYAAVTTKDQVYFAVVDIKKKTCSELFRGFEPFKDEDVGEEIQYEVDEMTFTADEKHLVYSNVFSNDIVFFDFRLKKKVQIVRGNPDYYTRSLKCSNDSKVMYFVKSTFVTFFDLKTSNHSDELEHTVDVTRACTNDMRTVVTSAEDSNVRVWDRSRKAQTISQTPAIEANRIRMLHSLPNPRYVLGFGFKSRANDSQFLFVYDLEKHRPVRQRELDSSILHMEVLSDSEALIVHDVVQKIKVLKIDTLKVTREFQGYLPSRKYKFKLNKKRNEVVCLSGGRHAVKVYEISTGHVTAMLQTGTQDKLDGISTCSPGDRLVAWSEDSGRLFVFDLARRKLQKTIESRHTAMLDEEGVLLHPSGNHVVFKVEGLPPQDKYEQAEIYLEVWDTNKGSLVTSLVDVEYHNRYSSSKDRTGSSCAVDMFEFLDDSRLLSTHDDFILRVFNIQSGNLLHRVFGHRTAVEIVYSSEAPYVLTYGSWTEEMTLRLWDKKTFSEIASYTLDRTVNNLGYSSDCRRILGTIGKPAEVVTWSLHNFPGRTSEEKASYEELFHGQDAGGFLELVGDDDQVILDPSDPDQDMEENTSDDDDDFV
ncbi:hypothetical protein DPMN_011322 [Dreissena polymorpha]|nr:hypothetical protein DPMN_011322 [Dreissena polymorpha]